MYATHAQTPIQGDTFIDLVDFKWLMAGMGWWIDLSRLQRDMTYAGGCVQLGLASDSNLVRQRSVELPSLLARLGAHAGVALPCASTSLAL
jgi:hypothetical protein